MHQKHLKNKRTAKSPKEVTSIRATEKRLEGNLSFRFNQSLECEQITNKEKLNGFLPSLQHIIAKGEYRRVSSLKDGKKLVSRRCNERFDLILN